MVEELRVATMEFEVVERLKSFSLSTKETQGVELVEKDVSVGMEEAQRSIIGKIYGEKRAHFVGIRSMLMKLWAHKGLCKVLALAPNVFQFIFQEVANRDDILQGRPWLFDNQLLVLQPWSEILSWKDDSFNVSPFWIQVWHIPPQWFSIATGKKIGNMLGVTRDVLSVEAGGREDRHLKIQVELDLTKPLLRGTMLKYKNSERWVDFRYESLPTFCFYCGQLGHNEKQCSRRKNDLTQNCLLKEQFGYWLRAGNRKSEGMGNRGKGVRVEPQEDGGGQGYIYWKDRGGGENRRAGESCEGTIVG